MQLYGACVSSVLRVLREGRRTCRKVSHHRVLNVELVMICPDENDIEELKWDVRASVLANV